MTMIDTHAHLNFDEYKENFDEVLEDIKSSGVNKVIMPSSSPSDFDRIIKLAEKYNMLFAAIGVHPSEISGYNEETEKRIYELSAHNKVKAIGEIGLDYHWSSDTKEQQQVFKRQLDIAAKTGLPVIIHDREAHEDCFNILLNYKLKNVIFHCFSGDKTFMQRCLDKGYYIAIGGIVTFKKAEILQDAVKFLPLNRLLLETDSPYLAPVPFRGKVNTPAYLKYAAQKIAEIKGIDLDEVKRASSENAEKVFGL